MGHGVQRDHLPGNAAIGPGEQTGQRFFAQLVCDADEGNVVVGAVEALDENQRGNGRARQDLD